MSQVREILKKVKNSPQAFKQHLHGQWPSVFGFEVKGELVQFYRNDSVFETVLSFNHFVEFFTKYSNMHLSVLVKAYSQEGKFLGKGSFTVKDKGAFQVPLSQLAPGLDQFGMFSVSMKIEPKFAPEIQYVGALSPQFMTMLSPRDGKSAVQMIHSHKLKQGLFVLKRKHIRASSHVELLSDLQGIELFILNSGGSSMNSGLEVLDARTGQTIQTSQFQIPGYGVYNLKISPHDLHSKGAEAINFRYFFDRSVDHKKPILFRHFQTGSYSCNHT